MALKILQMIPVGPSPVWAVFQDPENSEDRTTARVLAWALAEDWEDPDERHVVPLVADGGGGDLVPAEESAKNPSWVLGISSDPKGERLL
jgi:hypothetical protein